MSHNRSAAAPDKNHPVIKLSMSGKSRSPAVMESLYLFMDTESDIKMTLHEVAKLASTPKTIQPIHSKKALALETDHSNILSGSSNPFQVILLPNKSHQMEVI